MLNCYKSYTMFFHIKKKSISRKGRLETCLNGKTAHSCFTKLNCVFKTKFICLASKESNNVSLPNQLHIEHNSVPNRIIPRKQPGLYMIRCISNDWRYYGESSNVSSRLASHKSLLNRQIHPNKCLQNDWNLYGTENFDFVVLFMGLKWELPYIRRAKETELIVLNRDLSYNILETSSKPGQQNPFWGRLHTPEAKKKISQALQGRPNDLLGRQISIRGVIYPSIAEASRQTNMARKTIRQKVDDPKITDFFEI